MLETKELNALFTLIDDPDQEVYITVTDKIIGYGTPIIPNLEQLWETTPNEEIQERIERIIHRLHYTDLVSDFTEWKNSAHNDLLFGALLVSKFQYPYLQTNPIIQDIEKIRRNVWLELNNLLTPLEQANVLSSILYNYYHLQGVEVNYNNPDEFFLHKVLEYKKGNSIANGLIYQIICEKLAINARIINIPKQCIIAFYQTDFDYASYEGNPQDGIHFYVDATNGQAFSDKELAQYLKKIKETPQHIFFTPMPYKRLIQLLLEEISKCFTNPSNYYKQTELLQLAELLC